MDLSKAYCKACLVFALCSGLSFHSRNSEHYLCNGVAHAL